MDELQVAVGMEVSVEFVIRDGEVESLIFDLVADEQADFSNGFLGLGTPLAQAILGASAGEVVRYEADDIREVRVRSVSISRRIPPTNVQERRDATLQSALDQANRTTAMIFATSYSSKWGDYDPDGIVDDLEGPREE